MSKKSCKPRRTQRKYEAGTLVADFRRLPAKEQSIFLQRMRRWLRRSGYLIFSIGTFWLIYSYL